MVLSEQRRLIIRRVKRLDFSAKYISLPCFVLCFILAITTVGTSVFVLNVFLTIFNGFAYWLNTTTRNRLLDMVEQLDEMQRVQCIRDLNPHRR